MKFFHLFNKKKEQEAVSVPADCYPFFAPVKGHLKDITESADSALASKETGDGILIQPSDYKIYAPADCTVVYVFPSKKALGLRTAQGVELLLQLENGNADTTDCNFKLAVKEDEEVKRGTLLCELDLPSGKGQADACNVSLVVTNLNELSETRQFVKKEKNKKVSLEDIIFEIA